MEMVKGCSKIEIKETSRAYATRGETHTRNETSLARELEMVWTVLLMALLSSRQILIVVS